MKKKSEKYYFKYDTHFTVSSKKGRDDFLIISVEKGKLKYAICCMHDGVRSVSFVYDYNVFHRRSRSFSRLDPGSKWESRAAKATRKKVVAAVLPIYKKIRAGLPADFRRLIDKEMSVAKKK